MEGDLTSGPHLSAARERGADGLDREREVGWRDGEFGPVWAAEKKREKEKETWAGLKQ